jgi:hypothetical protein
MINEQTILKVGQCWQMRPENIKPNEKFIIISLDDKRSRVTCQYADGQIRAFSIHLNEIAIFIADPKLRSYNRLSFIL